MITIVVKNVEKFLTEEEWKDYQKRDDGEIEIDKYPDKCHICGLSLAGFNFVGAASSKVDYEVNGHPMGEIYAQFQCRTCDESFLAKYDFLNSNDEYGAEVWNYFYIPPQLPKKIVIHEWIKEKIPNFCDLMTAGSEIEKKYKRLSGPIYRQALECLVKEYLVYLNPKTERIIFGKKFINLATLIDNLGSQEVQECSHKVRVIGNEKTHYNRNTYEGGDVDDMKDLIEVITFWIVFQEVKKRVLEKP